MARNFRHCSLLTENRMKKISYWRRAARERNREERTIFSLRLLFSSFPVFSLSIRLSLTLWMLPTESINVMEADRFHQDQLAFHMTELTLMTRKNVLTTKSLLNSIQFVPRATPGCPFDRREIPPFNRKMIFYANRCSLPLIRNGKEMKFNQLTLERSENRSWRIPFERFIKRRKLFFFSLDSKWISRAKKLHHCFD